MKPPLCPLLVSTIATCAGLALYLGYLELGRFTGGKLIKLEELNQQLADKLNEWHPIPERWKIAGRISIFIAFLTAAIAFIFCVDHIQETVAKLKVSLVVAICVAFAFYVIELATTQITLIGNARILCVFIPVFRTLSWILYPIAIFFEKLKKRARERDEQAEIKSVSTAEDEIMSLINRIDDQYPDNPENIELQADERRMIAGALKLDDKTVHEIMTPRVDIDAVQKNAPMTNLSRSSSNQDIAESQSTTKTSTKSSGSYSQRTSSTKAGSTTTRPSKNSSGHRFSHRNQKTSVTCWKTSKSRRPTSQSSLTSTAEHRES